MPDDQQLSPQDYEDLKQIRSQIPEGDERAGKIDSLLAGAPAPPEPSMLHKVGQTLQDVGTGAAKGFANTLYAPRRALSNYFPSMKEGLPPDGALDPTNTAQKVGKYGEQAAEFLVPGAAEEKAAALAPKAIRPLARIGAAGLSAGAVNKAQGGDFSTGAATGAVGGAIGEGLRAAAPKIAESALGIRKVDRAYGKTPGEAVLAETRGFRPSTVAESAGSRIGQLTPAMEGTLAGKTASSDPAVQVVDDAIAKATQQNNATLVDQLQKVRNQLTTEIGTGNPIASPMPADRLLDLKRGVRNQFISNWNPETMSGTRAVAAQAGHAANEELGRVGGPEFQSLNQRISSLIPVQERAESASRNAELPQRILHRAAAHTGALAGGLTGGVAGYRESGIPGAVIGGTAGVVLPEVMASPASQMILARRAAQPTLLMRAPIGAALSYGNRPEEEKKPRP